MALYPLGERLYRRPGRTLAWVALCLLVLIGVEGVLHRLRGQVLTAGLAAGEARWIWAPVDLREPRPLAFVAVRDFELPAVPAQARLRVLADEEYLLYVNGRRVASGRYHRGTGPDEVAVGEYLVAGGNRLLIEARSSWGGGGLLASLELAEAAGDGTSYRQLLGTGDSWRIFDQYQFGLRRGWLPLDGGQPPRVWASPPAGRWQGLGAGALRPSFDQVRRGAPEPPRRRHQHPDQPAVVTLDWGREVTGYLTLQLEPTSPHAGLIYLSSAPPVAGERAADVTVVAWPGAPRWQDPWPRRFRYAQIHGLTGLVAAELQPVDAAQVAPELPGGAVAASYATGYERGIFGIRPPLPRQPVPEMVHQLAGPLAGPVAIE